MSKFTYLVTVETERTTGLIASRDEQSERITTEIENLAGMVDLNGIGARSDSEYGVTDIDVWEMTKRDEKEMHAEYEQTVRDAAPDDRTLRNEIAAAKAEVEKYKSLYETQKSIVDQLLASPEFAETRIWTEDRTGGEKVRHFLPDGRYDRIHFKMDEGDDDATVTIAFDEYTGDLEVRANAMGRELMTLPKSGNELSIRMGRRHR